MPSVILPDRATREILKLAHDAEGDAQISVSDKGVIVEIGNTIIHARLIDAVFPGFANHIPSDGYKQMIVDVDDLEAALERLLSLGEGTRTTLKVEAATLTLALANATAGEAEENIPVDWQFEGVLQQRINANGFLRCLKHFKTDLCAIRFGEAGKPILFNEFSGEKIATHRTFLSMPMEGS